VRLLRFVSLLFAITGLGVLATSNKAQSPAGSGTSAFAENSPSLTINHPQVDLTYRRPTEKMKLRTYLLEAFGPIPIAGSAIIAAGNQYEGTPPEWGQGTRAYAQRFASNFATEAVTTTTQYGLAEAFREDTAYYRCQCNGFFARFKHAMISTVTARYGEDGHRRFSVSALAAPYAGTFTTVYGWYPSRYGANDAVRMGSYDVLASAGENLFLEFIYGGPRTPFGHFHRTASSGTGPAITPSH
jgi:hypothetical protein